MSPLKILTQSIRGLVFPFEPQGPIFDFMIPNSEGCYPTGLKYGEWGSGKQRGGISKINHKYIIRYQGRILYSVDIEDSDSEAYALAANWLDSYNRKHHLYRNLMREVEDFSGVYLEVKASSIIFKCSLIDKPTVQDHIWRHNRQKNWIYTTIDKDLVYFHHFITNTSEGKVTFADGNKLNICRENLVISKEAQ